MALTLPLITPSHPVTSTDHVGAIIHPSSPLLNSSSSSSNSSRLCNSRNLARAQATRGGNPRLAGIACRSPVAVALTPPPPVPVEMIEVENVVPLAPDVTVNHGESPMGQLMGLPVAMQTVDAFGLFPTVLAVIVAFIIVVEGEAGCVLQVALMQTIVSVPVLGIVMGAAAEMDELGDDDDTVAIDEMVAFQSLHPVGLLPSVHDVVAIAPEMEVVLFVQEADKVAAAEPEELVGANVIFALVADSVEMSEDSGEEESGDPEVLVSSMVLLPVLSLGLDDVEEAASDFEVELAPGIELEASLGLDVACTGSKSREKLLSVLELSTPDAKVLLVSPNVETDPVVVAVDEIIEVSTGSWSVIVRCAGREVTSVVMINTVSVVSLAFADCGAVS